MLEAGRSGPAAAHGAFAPQLAAALQLAAAPQSAAAAPSAGVQQTTAAPRWLDRGRNSWPPQPRPWPTEPLQAPGRVDRPASHCRRTSDAPGRPTAAFGMSSSPIPAPGTVRDLTRRPLTPGCGRGSQPERPRRTHTEAARRQACRDRLRSLLIPPTPRPSACGLLTQTGDRGGRPRGDDASAQAPVSVPTRERRS